MQAFPSKYYTNCIFLINDACNVENKQHTVHFTLQKQRQRLHQVVSKGVILRETLVQVWGTSFMLEYGIYLEKSLLKNCLYSHGSVITMVDRCMFK